MVDLATNSFGQPVYIVSGNAPGRGEPVDGNNPVFVRSTGANSSSRLAISAATINATTVKNSSANLYLVTGYNSANSARWLKLYNKGSNPVPGVDVPVWSEYLAPVEQFQLPFAGMFFSQGLSYTLTVGGADADATALSAGDILGLNLAFA